MSKINSRKRNLAGNRPSADCADGFTLLEIMVSIAILGAAIVMIIQLFAASHRSIVVSEGYLQAELKAEEKLREVLEDEKKLAEGSISETKENYAVSVDVKPVKEDRTQDLSFQLMEVTLNMKWNDGSKQHNITLNTYKLASKDE